MRKETIALATLAGALVLLIPSQGHAQTVGTVAATSSTTVSSTTAGQFFSGFAPSHLTYSMTPMNFNTPLQSGVNYSAAMTPTTTSTSFYNSNMIGNAFANITFPLFRSVAPSVPIVQPGPNNPIQPSSIPAFYSAKQLKQLKGQ
jgi:hypothetical protein